MAFVERRSDDGAGKAAPAGGASTFVRAPGVLAGSAQSTTERGTLPVPPGAASGPSPALQVAAAPRLRLQVHAPTDARVGEHDDVRVDVDAGGAMRELRFALTYDKSRLALVEWSVGDFALRDGVAVAELHADEPSEGSIEMHLDAGSGRWLAGAGSIAVLRFEARKAGTSPVSLTDAVAIDASGIAGRLASDLHAGSVTIR